MEEVHPWWRGGEKHGTRPIPPDKSSRVVVPPDRIVDPFTLKRSMEWMGTQLGASGPANAKESCGDVRLEPDAQEVLFGPHNDHIRENHGDIGVLDVEQE